MTTAYLFWGKTHFMPDREIPKDKPPSYLRLPFIGRKFGMGCSCKKPPETTGLHCLIFELVRPTKGYLDGTNKGYIYELVEIT